MLSNGISYGAFLVWTLWGLVTLTFNHLTLKWCCDANFPCYGQPVLQIWTFIVILSWVITFVNSHNYDTTQHVLLFRWHALACLLFKASTCSIFLPSSNFGRLFFQTENSYICGLSYNLYNLKCTKVQPMYQNSLEWCLNTDHIFNKCKNCGLCTSINHIHEYKPSRCDTSEGLANIPQKQKS